MANEQSYFTMKRRMADVRTAATISAARLSCEMRSVDEGVKPVHGQGRFLERSRAAPGSSRTDKVLIKIAQLGQVTRADIAKAMPHLDYLNDISGTLTALVNTGRVLRIPHPDYTPAPKGGFRDGSPPKWLFTVGNAGQKRLREIAKHIAKQRRAA